MSKEPIHRAKYILMFYGPIKNDIIIMSGVIARQFTTNSQVCGAQQHPVSSVSRVVSIKPEGNGKQFIYLLLSVSTSGADRRKDVHFWKEV